MLALMLLSAASLSTTKPAIHALPVNFDIASIDRARAEEGRKRWMLPRVDALEEDDDGSPLFKFKGNKVRLKVPL